MRCTLLALLFIGGAGCHNTLTSGTPETEFETIRRQAEGGDASAQSRLGLMYADGIGVPRDDAAAVTWYRKAAEQGDAAAQMNLGKIYAQGQGVDRDDTEALKWFRQAAEQGDAGAQHHLGLMYANGEGTQQNDVDAYIWLSIALNSGHPFAQKSRQPIAARLSDEQRAAAEQRAADLTTNIPPGTTH